MTNTEITNASKIMLGSTEASAMYIGSSLVWLKVLSPYDCMVEYIESSGTQYIDTSYKVTPNMSFSLEILFVLNEHTNTNTNNGNNNVFLATSNYEGDYTFGFNFGSTARENNDIIFWTNTRYLGGTVYRINDILDSVLKNKSNLSYLNLTINYGSHQISVPQPTHTFTTETLLLFGGKDRAPFNRWNMRIYSMKIYDNNILIRDFIPVKKNNVGYLYDKVSEQLFGNSGSGSFILGPDIIEIEYLQSSNEQYIETGIIPDSNTGIYIKASWDSGLDNYIVGLRNTNGNTRWCIGESGYGWYWGYGNYTKGYNGNYNNYLNITAQSAIVECKLNYLNDSKWYGEGPNNVLVLQTLPTLPFTPSYNIRLFGSAGISADYTKFSGKLYFVKISQGQDVIMDLVPVRVGQVGYMYDKISGRLFGNSGSGTFTLGPDKQ